MATSQRICVVPPFNYVFDYIFFLLKYYIYNKIKTLVSFSVGESVSIYENILILYYSILDYLIGFLILEYLSILFSVLLGYYHDLFLYLI